MTLPGSIKTGAPGAHPDFTEICILKFKQLSEDLSTSAQTHGINMTWWQQQVRWAEYIPGEGAQRWILSIIYFRIVRRLAFRTPEL
jgi:hypothetical protein